MGQIIATGQADTPVTPPATELLHSLLITRLLGNVTTRDL
jgi:hypothetical protein